VDKYVPIINFIYNPDPSENTLHREVFLPGWALNNHIAHFGSSFISEHSYMLSKIPGKVKVFFAQKSS
jgi:hypothetical protein|tara:strand:- start:891 stop:1094 length:204 start_codon:yes stop_codon:yes gene_type:complete